MLGVALGKAQDHKVELEDLNQKIVEQRGVAYKTAV